MFTIEELFLALLVAVVGLLATYTALYLAVAHFLDRYDARASLDEWDARAPIGNDINTTLKGRD